MVIPLLPPILLVTETSLVSSGRGQHKGVTTKRWGHWGSCWAITRCHRFSLENWLREPIQSWYERVIQAGPESNAPSPGPLYLLCRTPLRVPGWYSVPGTSCLYWDIWPVLRFTEAKSGFSCPLLSCVGVVMGSVRGRAVSPGLSFGFCFPLVFLQKRFMKKLQGSLVLSAPPPSLTRRGCPTQKPPSWRCRGWAPSCRSPSLTWPQRKQASPGPLRGTQPLLPEDLRCRCGGGLALSWVIRCPGDASASLSLFAVLAGVPALSPGKQLSSLQSMLRYTGQANVLPFKEPYWQIQ